MKTRGLPYEATKNEIIQFLEECNTRNGQDGVHILVAVDGRPNGEAIVELQSRVDVDNALKCHNKNMGRRYVEVSEISREEMNWELSRQPGVVSENPRQGVRVGGGIRPPLPESRPPLGVRPTLYIAPQSF